MSDTRSKDFNIYYLNFSKVYEIAMMINNVILTKIDRDNTSEYSKAIGYTASLSAQGTKNFLEGIKSSISSETKETSYPNINVIVKTAQIDNLLDYFPLYFEGQKSVYELLPDLKNVEEGVQASDSIVHICRFIFPIYHD